MDCEFDSADDDRMNAFEVLLTLVGSVVALDLVAMRWGADTREPGEWRWRVPPDGGARKRGVAGHR